MLKACWDCVAGSGVLRTGGDNEGSYGIQLNGDSQRAPLRPEDRNMLRLPRAINYEDEINLTLFLNNPERFTVNLLTGYSTPDSKNIACQLEANSNEDTVKIILDGQTVSREQVAIQKDSWLDIRFQLLPLSDGPTLSVYVKQSHVAQVPLKHEFDKINFLEFIGDGSVKALEFKFA